MFFQFLKCFGIGAGIGIGVLCIGYVLYTLIYAGLYKLLNGVPF